MKERQMNLAELVRYYDAYNRSEGKASSTLRWYNQVLRLFPGLKLRPASSVLVVITKRIVSNVAPMSAKKTD